MIFLVRDALVQIERMKNLKTQRIAVQKENVKRKREQEEEARKLRMEKKRARLEGTIQKSVDGDEGDDEGASENDEDEESVDASENIED